MKKIFIFLIIVTLFSCEKGTPLNMEADILSFDFKEGILKHAITPGSEIIDIYIDKNTEVSSLTPLIKITKGAVITPESGIPQDFSNTVIYNVTSEDGKWTRTYKVTLHFPVAWSFDFEKWEKLNDTYEHPYGWTSANAGVYTMNSMLAEKIEYPTYKTTNSYKGKYAAEVQSRKGGQSSYIPSILSGSLFLGSFSTFNALIDPLLCPQFGVIFNYNGNNAPEKLTGWIKYSPGKIYIDENGKQMHGITDECLFYAKIFEGSKPLNGKNIKSSDRIVAEAQMDKTIFPMSKYGINEFTYVEIPFKYKKDMDISSHYMITIVAASSADGDNYHGAPGSRFTIDNIELK